MNEFKNTELYNRLISNQNIYLSIYSLESYIFNKELLSKKDRDMLNRLNDKFDEKYIKQIIKKVRIRLEELVTQNGCFVQSKVYFNPKKYENERVSFRPLHISNLIEQIAIVSILNLFIYEWNSGNEELILSNVSRLIPSNFYGNRVSTSAEVLFKPWKKQYKLYTQKANELFNTYYTTQEYKYEINLDLKNFFPSVNPKILYHLILSLSPVILNQTEMKLYRILLIKLLICEITNLEDETRALYYGDGVQNLATTFGCGIAQGLPQSYFLGNICMIEISKIFERYFKGESLYYVDDSVIFSNEIQNDQDFTTKLEMINEDIKWFQREYLHEACQNNSDPNEEGSVLKIQETEEEEFFRLYNEKMICFLRSQVHIFSIEVHGIDGKSSYTEIKKSNQGERYLRVLSREVSQIGMDLYTTYSDEEDDNLNAKMKVLLDAIEQEQNKIRIKTLKLELNSEGTASEELNSLLSYDSKLSRYYKYFKYRKMKLDIQKNEDDILDLYEEILLSPDKPDFYEKFIEIYKRDIWGAYLGLFVSRTDSKGIEKVKTYISEVNNKIFGYENKKSSYIFSSYESLLWKRADGNVKRSSYETLDRLVYLKLRKYISVQGEVVNKFVKGTVQKYKWENLLKETGFFSEEFLKMIGIVDSSTAELKRHVLNAIYSQLFHVQLNDSLMIVRQSKRHMSYGELRMLAGVRNTLFSEKIYLEQRVDLNDGNNQLKIDYSIMEVIEVFRTFVKHPVLIDKLILVHQYTCDVWKNGSKYLYFYTLHNQEHAIVLIKNVIKVLKAIDYLQISTNDFYILFIACYLHDISMVRIPSAEDFLMNSEMADMISAEYMNKIAEDSYTSDMEVKNLLMQFYKKIDDFFEWKVRSSHAGDSASEIRNRNDLAFLENCLRDRIAEISYAHGQRVEDIYNIKSEARNSLVSMKFDKILLRMADLLDMSGYRVSKPILNHNVEQMSNISAFHWISHLLTQGFRIKTEYRVINQNESVWAPKNIEEKIIIQVDVLFSQLSKMEKDTNCRYGYLDTELVSTDRLVIRCGESCKGEKCNFLCRWFVKKNEYLLMELNALKSYLNRIPNNFYMADIEIQLNIVDKTKLDAKQFEILKSNL